MKREGVIFSAILAFVNLLLVTLKIVIGFVSNSVSVFADAFNNLGDFFTCSSCAYGFAVSDKKPNKRHPHGYGRIEYILSLLLSFVVVIVGAVFIKDSLERLFEPGIIAYRKSFLYILLVSAFIKLLMSIITKIVNKDVKSPMFKMIEIDNLQDFFISLLTCVSFYLSSGEKGDIPIDGYIGTIIGFILLIKAIIEITKLTKKLLGETIDKKEYKKIIELFNKNELLISEIVSHDYGPKNKYLVLSIYEKEKNDEKLKKLKEILLKDYITKLTVETNYIDDEKYKNLKTANEILSKYTNNITYLIDEKNEYTFNINIIFANKNDEIENELKNKITNNFKIKYFA